MNTGADHGGAFWNAIGPDFRHLERRGSIINADVLDAWFPPSQKVLEALKEPSEWLYRTSPPTDGDGMITAIRDARGVDEARIVLGAGSSDLIFRAFLMMLRPSSRALVPDPTYGEYAHVLSNVVGCQVDRLPLVDWQIDLEAAKQRLNTEAYDVFVLVNPNSPTGQVLEPSEVEAFVEAIPARTMVWIDEAYADYAGITCESLVNDSRNVVVGKSMSKVYSLSGVRAGYAVGPKQFVEGMQLRTPPWIVSLPGQIAACAALGDPAYYADMFEETRRLGRELAHGLRALGGTVLEGKANFVLWFLPAEIRTEKFVKRCAEQGLYLRDAASIGAGLDQAVRISVKDESSQHRILEIVRRVMEGC
jgi:histidinol-phosphate/aromatic aminotransferase/cobyric acid decarboxylase-like protein